MASFSPTIVPFYKTPHISIKSSVISPAALPTLQQVVACVGHRSLIDGASQLTPLTPAPGYPQLQYFQPFTMPPLGSGNEALAYMKSLGFSVNYGLSGSLLFPAPSSITTDSYGTVTLNYSTQPQNYNLLLQNGFTANITQATSGATGIFLSASTSSYAITLKNVSGNFVTTASNTISLSFINSSLGLPDPNRTEEICMQVYHIYKTINEISGGGQYNFVKPGVVISVLTNRETNGSFSPNPANISLGIPTTVSVQTSGDVYIGWASVPTQAAYVPLGPLGSTALNQVTSLATGTLKGILAPFTITGCAFVVNVGPVTGTFNTTNIINLNLDATQSVLDLLRTTPFTAVVNPYNVATNTDISTNQVEFFDFIAEINQPEEVEGGHFGVLGVFANTTITATSMGNSLPTDVNNHWYAPVYYPYVPYVGEYPQTSALVAAAYAAFFSCNSAPYNPQALLIMPSLLSSENTQNRVVYGTKGVTSSEIALDLGWTPLCVNTAGQVSPARLITGQLTLPGTSVLDVEFFPITTWQIVTYFQQQIYVALIAAGVKQLRQSPQVLTKVKGVVIAAMQQCQTLGMFENVEVLAKLVTVTRSNVPDTIIIQIPITIIPELASANVQVGLISSVFNLAA
jgi:hypothetical protein